jgi:protein subunit release factor A
MKPSLLSKLDQLTQRLEEVSALMNQEGATADMEHYANSRASILNWSRWSPCTANGRRRRLI